MPAISSMPGKEMSCGRGRGRRTRKNTKPQPKPDGPTRKNNNSKAKIVEEKSNFCDAEKNCEIKDRTGNRNCIDNNTSENNGDLIAQIESVNFSDKRFDKEMQCINAHFEKCGSKEKVEKSFEDVFKECLCDPEKSAKLAVLVVTSTFPVHRAHSTHLRRLFVSNLQKYFEERNILKAKNPYMYRNLVLMIGKFIKTAGTENKASLSDFLTSPFLSCLDMLVDPGATQDDVMYFTAELYLNAERSMETHPSEIKNLLNKARLLLVSDDSTLTESAKYWLMTVIQLPEHKCDVFFTHLSQFVW